jgi:ketosteroid isomerase-like protein
LGSSAGSPFGLGREFTHEAQPEDGYLARCERNVWSVASSVSLSAVLAVAVDRIVHRQQKGEAVKMTAQDNVDDFIEQFTLAQGELLKGNAEPVKKCYAHRQDVTLGNPFGPFVRGWEQIGAVVDHAASQLRDGEMVEGETVTRYVTPELAYLVRVERSQAKVGGQDAVTPISLRATMIMAREDGVWKIVHRHADPITTARPAESVIQQ